MIFKAHFYVTDTESLVGLLDTIKAQVLAGQQGEYTEQYPFYSGDWAINPSGKLRYSQDELDDLSTIPFGR